MSFLKQEDLSKKGLGFVDKVVIERAVAPKKRFMAGFHEYLQRHLADNCDYEFIQVMDLGERCGSCEHCGTPIRYEFYVKSISKDEEFILGSTCITKVEWLSKFLHLTPDEFQRVLSRKSKEYKDKFRREDNRERYGELVEFIDEYLSINSIWELRSIIIDINKGRKLSKEQIATFREYEEKTDLVKMKAEHEEFLKRNKDEREARLSDSEAKRTEYEELVSKTLELSKYVTSPFLLDMARKLKTLNGGDLLFSLPRLLSDKQFDSLKEAVAEYDLEELEFQKEQTADLREEQIAVLDNVIHRVEVEEHDFVFRDGKGTYLGMFKNIRARLDKRVLTEKEEATVDKFLDKHGRELIFDSKENMTVHIEEKVQLDRIEKGAGKVVEDRKKIEELLDF